jgi:hypothetical protein
MLNGARNPSSRQESASKNSFGFWWMHRRHSPAHDSIHRWRLCPIVESRKEHGEPNARNGGDEGQILWDSAIDRLSNGCLMAGVGVSIRQRASSASDGLNLWAPGVVPMIAAARVAPMAPNSTGSRRSPIAAIPPEVTTGRAGLLRAFVGSVCHGRTTMSR